MSNHCVNDAQGKCNGFLFGFVYWSKFLDRFDEKKIINSESYG